MGSVTDLPERVGLIWIGESFYGTTDEFIAEAKRMGISRRLSAIPRGFTVGETAVWLAHRKAIETTGQDGTVTYAPGVFYIFKPEAIEYVVTGQETEDQLDRLETQGFTIVAVKREQGELFDATQP